MKNVVRFLTSLLAVVSLTACNQHFLSDADERAKVEQDYAARLSKLPAVDQLDVLLSLADTYEQEALHYLYAYMPMADLADEPCTYHYMNIQSARKARKRMPWGGKVPDELFREYVFPARVLDEPTDSAKVFFYERLNEQLRKLSACEAVKAVNTYCGQRAVYRPDGTRTAAPQATLRSASGTWTELSVMVASALRAVAIPARVVCEPTGEPAPEDKAWVEAWYDGEWHSLLPCYPDVEVSADGSFASWPEPAAGLPQTQFARLMSHDDALRFATLYKLPQEEEAVRLLTSALGNHSAISNFMARLRSEKSKKGGFDMMSRLSDEDLRDISLQDLIDHMQSHVRTNAELFNQYVRNPRIDDEVISPYKVALNKKFSQSQADDFAARPELLAEWVSTNIEVDSLCNVGAPPISPIGVWNNRVADAHSRDIFFVALARSLGIPARIDKETGAVIAYYADGREQPISFPR